MVKVTITYLFIILVYPFLMGCGQESMHMHRPAKDTATCIFLGNDSLAYYYGNSNDMQELEQGSIYDTLFTNEVVKSIKKHLTSNGFKIAFKPTTAIANVDTMPNGRAELLDIFRINEINDRDVYIIDTPDNIEKKAFNVETWHTDDIGLIGSGSFKLNLPSDESNDSLANNTKTWKNAITILIYGDNKIYTYEGGNIAAGKKYSYTTIDNYLKNKAKIEGKDLEVIIKPNDLSSYKNIVDLLDEMKLNNIGKYALVDITKEEDDFIKALK